MSDSAPAVFLSYAREDTDAARRIAEALRAFGVEAWFDQSELRGGDTWDAKIRGQIRGCALFLPIVSARTQSRAEGYFRREWKLAVERTHDMAAGVAFIVPVVIDDTPESEAAVPDEFMRVQWTRLAHGVPTPQFVEQIKRLLESPRKASAATRPAFPIASPAAASAPASTATAPRSSGFPMWVIGAVAVVAIGAAIYFAQRPTAVAPAKPVAEEKSVASVPSASHLPSSTSSPTPEAPAKSIAVLPFANLSTEKENEFFADGVQDDVITNLAKIRDLTVISRTSTLAYRDTASRNVKKIAAELGVANILEGSVRRVGSKVHMNAQLIDARTDAHLWADTFDGDASDIFALQATLAQKIAAALKATLTPSERTLIERRPTQNQAAYDFYQRGKLQAESLTPRSSRERYEEAAALFERAIAEDPGFVLVYPRLAYVNGLMYWFGNLDPSPERKARTLAVKNAMERLAPDSPEMHQTRGTYAYYIENDWNLALAEYRAAEASLPNDSQLLATIGYTHRRLGHWPEGLTYMERAIALSPHDFYTGTQVALFLLNLHHYERALEFAKHYATWSPRDGFAQDLAIRSQANLDGDRAALLRALVTRAPFENDPDGLQSSYEHAMLSGNLPAAEKALADPRFRVSRNNRGGVFDEPVALHRALVAWLLGQSDAAKRFADEAIGTLEAGHPTPRQEPYALMCRALAEALAGRRDDALRNARAAAATGVQRDVYASLELKYDLGRVYLLLGRSDEALTALREIVTTPTETTPIEIRMDPLWSRLKDDPRFDEILKSAKPL